MADVNLLTPEMREFVKANDERFMSQEERHGVYAFIWMRKERAIRTCAGHGSGRYRRQP